MKNSAEEYFCKEELDCRDFSILKYIFNSGTSLYKLEKITKIPIATLWRIVNRLERLGYVYHSSRGKYELTLKGLFYLLFNEGLENEKIMLSISERINKDVEKTRTIVRCLITTALENKTCILDYINELRPLLRLAVVKALEGKLLHRYFVEFITERLGDEVPFVELEGCKLITITTNRGTEILIGKCKKQGYVSHIHCPHYYISNIKQSNNILTSTEKLSDKERIVSS